MAAKKTQKQKPWNVRISGQIEADSIEAATAKLAAGIKAWKPGGPEKCAACSAKLTGNERFCPNCATAVPVPSGPLLDGGIVRITLEGA
jgi:hypothetical protein